MKWFLIFLGMPLLEIFIFLKINEVIGILSTLTIIISTAVIGAFFVKAQAFNVINSFKNLNGNPLLLIPNGIIILISGILLLTPGFITDIIGFSLLLPRFRQIIINVLSKKFNQN